MRSSRRIWGIVSSALFSGFEPLPQTLFSPLLFSRVLCHSGVLGVEPLATLSLKGRGSYAVGVAKGVNTYWDPHPRPPQAQDRPRRPHGCKRDWLPSRKASIQNSERACLERSSSAVLSACLLASRLVGLRHGLEGSAAHSRPRRSTLGAPRVLAASGRALKGTPRRSLDRHSGCYAAFQCKLEKVIQGTLKLTTRKQWWHFQCCF